MRSHEPITIEEFFGLWDRSDRNSCPQDHFTECDNVDFNTMSVYTRGSFRSFANRPSSKIRRMFVFTRVGQIQLLLALLNGDLYELGIYPAVLSANLIHSAADGTDYDMAMFNNKAYIVKSSANGYVGTGTMLIWNGVTLTTSGGSAPATAATVANGAAAGNVEVGVHYYGVAYETDSGFITPPTATNPVSINSTGILGIDLTNIPTGPAGTAARRIIATRVIPNPIPGSNISNYESYFVPGGRIPDNVTTTLTINFFDSELLEPASYLFDIYTAPPGGSAITVFNNRICIGGISSNPSSIVVSRVNDPETFDQVDGLVTVETQNTPVFDNGTALYRTGITDLQVYRDVLYATKLNAMSAISDNGDVPSSWQVNTLDNSSGSWLHGIIPVIYSGGVNIEHLLIAGPNGLYVFNGIFNFPELSWKIDKTWQLIDWSVTSSNYMTGTINFSNDSINRKLHICMGYDGDTEPKRILMMDYREVNLNDPASYKRVKWSKWSFDTGVFYPTCVICYIQGREPAMLLGDGFGNFIYDNGVIGAVQVPISKVRTAVIGNKSSGMVHLGSVRFNAENNGTPQNIQIVASDENITRTQTSPNIVLPNNNNREKAATMNFTAQGIMITMQTAAGGYFKLLKLIPFVKDTFKNVPNTSA